MLAHRPSMLRASINQSISQFRFTAPVNQSINQSVNQSINQFRSFGHSSHHKKPSKKVTQSINQSIKDKATVNTVKEAINQSIQQPYAKSVKHSPNQSINHSVVQPTNQSTSQPINQPIIPSVTEVFVPLGDAGPDTVPSPSSAPTMEELLSNRALAQATSSSTQVTSPHHDQVLPHPLWTKDQLEKIDITHRQPQGLIDWLAYTTIRIMRFNFDWMSGWNRLPETKRYEKSTNEGYDPNVKGPQNLAIDQALSRIVFLETVAGIPGSIAGMLRHLASLRRMRRDNGWINMLLGEAENERMHLLTAIQMKQPSRAFRALVVLTQGVFFNFFWVAYLVSPKFCHRMVGYLEEEATKTYTTILSRVDDGTYREWQTQPAPLIAIRYWKMDPKATMRDVICVIRADESHHRDVNHHMADIPRDALAVYSVKIATEKH